MKTLVGQTIGPGHVRSSWGFAPVEHPRMHALLHLPERDLPRSHALIAKPTNFIWSKNFFFPLRFMPPLTGLVTRASFANVAYRVDVNGLGLSMLSGQSDNFESGGAYGPGRVRHFFY